MCVKCSDPETRTDGHDQKHKLNNNNSIIVGGSATRWYGPVPSGWYQFDRAWASGRLSNKVGVI
mgnify:CR=1 FL=1